MWRFVSRELLTRLNEPNGPPRDQKSRWFWMITIKFFSPDLVEKTSIVNLDVFLLFFENFKHLEFRLKNKTVVNPAFFLYRKRTTGRCCETGNGQRGRIKGSRWAGRPDDGAGWRLCRRRGQARCSDHRARAAPCQAGKTIRAERAGRFAHSVLHGVVPATRQLGRFSRTCEQSGIISCAKGPVRWRRSVRCVHWPHEIRIVQPDDWSVHQRVQKWVSSRVFFF